MTDLLGLLLYHGSALLPVGYLVLTLFRGRHRRAMLIAIVTQFFVSCSVVAFSYWCRAVGYSEWYWALAFNIPVNVLFAFVYIVILCLPRFDSPRSGDLFSEFNRKD